MRLKDVHVLWRKYLWVGVVSREVRHRREGTTDAGSHCGQTTSPKVFGFEKTMRRPALHGVPATVKQPSLDSIETARPRTITAASWTFSCDARAAATTRHSRGSIGQIRAEGSLLHNRGDACRESNRLSSAFSFGALSINLRHHGAQMPR